MPNLVILVHYLHISYPHHQATKFINDFCNITRALHFDSWFWFDRQCNLRSHSLMSNQWPPERASGFPESACITKDSPVMEDTSGSAPWLMTWATTWCQRRTSRWWCSSNSSTSSCRRRGRSSFTHTQRFQNKTIFCYLEATFKNTVRRLKYGFLQEGAGVEQRGETC